MSGSRRLCGFERERGCSGCIPKLERLDKRAPLGRAGGPQPGWRIRRGGMCLSTSSARSSLLTWYLATGRVSWRPGSLSSAAAHSNRSPRHPLPRVQPLARLCWSPGLCHHQELGAPGSWRRFTLLNDTSDNLG